MYRRDNNWYLEGFCAITLIYGSEDNCVDNYFEYFKTDDDFKQFIYWLQLHECWKKASEDVITKRKNPESII